MLNMDVAAYRSRQNDAQQRKITIMNIQRDLVITQSDLKKMQIRRQNLDAILRRIILEKSRLRMEENDTLDRAKKLDNEIRMTEEEMKRLRKSMGAVR